MRILRFIALVVVFFWLLRFVPVVGGMGLIRIWVAILLASWFANWAITRAVQLRQDQAIKRELGAVDSPYNKGKLGALLVGQKRFREAIPQLEEAIEGDPNTIEWPYRLGTALLAVGRPGDAVTQLENVVEREEEHAYGGAMLRLAEARTAAGQLDGALEALDRFDRNHARRRRARTGGVSR